MTGLIPKRVPAIFTVAGLFFLPAGEIKATTAQFVNFAMKDYGQLRCKRAVSVISRFGTLCPPASRRPRIQGNSTILSVVELKMKHSSMDEEGSKDRGPNESTKIPARNWESKIVRPQPVQQPSTQEPSDPIGKWNVPATITKNNFKFKSLSNWSFNTAVGCSHGCRFCYVPSASTVKLKPQLATHGVNDPDAEWGQYALLRRWDENAFLRSLKLAEQTPIEDLQPDGNRAVILCSTTDPYQVFPHPNPVVRKQLMKDSSVLVHRALELILERSTLNVRILTRSPLAKRDFDIYREFGDRLLFGMSLPTLDNRLAKVYEPGAPSPAKRLETLQAAKEAGLHVYVAVAPTYPECGVKDFEQTLAAIRPLNPLTIFHEPINIRSENVERIDQQAAELGIELKIDVFANRRAWREYANTAFWGMEAAAHEQGLEDHLHLWPDSTLGSKEALGDAFIGNPDNHLEWLRRWWNRISEWPGQD